MKTRTKVFIGIGVAGVLLVLIVLGAIIAGGAYLFRKADDPALIAKTNQAKSAGAAYGRTSDQAGCMQKGFTLEPPADLFDNSNETFVNACLHASRPTTDFCDGVPFVFDRKWFADECQKAGQQGPGCTVAFMAKRNFCRLDGDDKK